MRMIKAFAAIAAMIVMAACSSEQQAAAPATTTTIAPGSVADFRQNVGDRVFFDTDMSTIRDDGRTTLNRQAEWLKKYTNYPITIAGHCDERGTREYNLALGERRANAARQYLIAQGVPAARVKTISYGKERPDPSAPTTRRGRSTAAPSPSSSKRPAEAGRIESVDDAGRLSDRRFHFEAGRPCLKMAAFEPNCRVQ